MNWGLFLRHFIFSLMKIKFRLMFLAVTIIVAVGLFLTLEKPNFKTSWVLLLPGTERNSTISLDNLGEAQSNGRNAYGSVSISPKNTYKEIALSDAVIELAADQYGVDAVAFSKPKITLIDQTPAMKFTLIGEVKEELAYRAKLYNDTFHNILDKLRKNEIERNYQGIENNLADAKERLAKARQDIVAHQVSSNFISEQQLQRWMNDAEALRTEQGKSEIQAARLEATLVTSLYQLGISSEQAEKLLLILSNPSMKTNLAQLSEQLTEQVSLKSQFANENPLVKTIEREVTSLTLEVRAMLSEVPEIETITNTQLFALLSANAAQSIQSISTSLATFDGLKAQNEAIKGQQQQYAQRIKQHAQDAATLADLQRDHQIAEAIFSSALAKLDTSRLDVYATYPLTQLLTQPGATIKRDRLKSKLMIVAGLLIFGMLSLAMTMAHMRKTFMTGNQQQNAESEPDTNKTAQERKSQKGSLPVMPKATELQAALV